MTFWHGSSYLDDMAIDIRTLRPPASGSPSDNVRISMEKRREHKPDALRLGTAPPNRSAARQSGAAVLIPSLVVLLCGLFGLAGVVHAQSSAADDPWAGVEEMLVISGASDILSGTGASASTIAFGEDELIAVGATDISDIASFTPNLEIVTAGSSTPTFFIRGVGLNDFNPNSTGAVSIYLDDVNLNAPPLQLPELFDVEGVNVLRGPQGVGLARNASAGAIRVATRKPTDEFGGYISASVGNFNFREYEGALNAPIVPDFVAARIAFRIRDRDGWMNNNCAGAPGLDQRVRNPGVGGGVQGSGPTSLASLCGEPVAAGQISPIPVGLARNLNDENNWGLRGTVTFDPTPDLSFTLNGHGSSRDEYTVVGQSIGTSGNFCIEGPGFVCSGPTPAGGPFAVPPELVGTRSDGLLGGGAGVSGGFASGYVPQEIRSALIAAAPCFAALGTSAGCDSPLLPLQERIDANTAQIRLARSLARDLDRNPFSGDFNRTGKTTVDKYGFYLKGKYDLDVGGISISTTTAYDKYRRRREQDLDFSPVRLFEITTNDQGGQFYQDIKIEGDFDFIRPISWEAGAWFLREDLDVIVNNDLSPIVEIAAVLGRDYTQRTESAAGYISGSIELTEELEIDGGFRWNWESKEFSQVLDATFAPPDQLNSVNVDWQDPTGHVRLTYNFTESISTFFKYTRGFKPGSINATSSQFTGVTVAEPEVIDSFEWGISASWFDDIVTFDGNVFFYAYQQYQIFTIQQLSGSPPQFLVLNADNAEVLGAEAEFSFRPWEGFQADVRAAWLETQFLDFVIENQFLSTGPEGTQVEFTQLQNSGNPLLNSPRFKVSLSAQQTVPVGKLGSVTLRWDGVWTDQTFFDPTAGAGLGNEDGFNFLPNGTISQPSYWLHNLRLTWKSLEDRFELAVWARNLENQAYRSFAFDASSFQNTTIFFIGEPRTYGATAKLRFF